MLDPLDAAVAQRDPRIPGLSSVLDPEAIFSLLSDRIPQLRGGDPTALTPLYTRYKPCSNCLVGYELRLESGERVALHAKAFRSSDDPRLTKASKRESLSSTLGPAYVVDRDAAVVVWIFPNDPKVDQLWRWFDPSQAADLHRRVLKRSNTPAEVPLTLSPLAYKPERRFVGQLSDPSGRGVAVLKLFRRGALPSNARRRFTNLVNALGEHEFEVPVVPSELTRDENRAWLALGWIDGIGLRDRLAGHDPIAAEMDRVGAALAALHASPAGTLSARRDERRALTQTMALLEILIPRLGRTLRRIASRLEDRIDPVGEGGPIHGDFYAKQVLIGPRVAFLDFDGAGLGPRGWDLGCFLAHLDRDRLRGAVRPERAGVAEAALIDGYARGGVGLPADVDAHRALALLQIATHPFRRREPEWDERISALVGEAERFVVGRSPTPRHGGELSRDADLPSLASALDVDAVQSAYDAENCPRPVTFRRAELLRHKPGRRALVAYEIKEGGEVWLGKLRRRGVDTKTFDLSRSLWKAGFEENAPDGIEIPEPIATIEILGLWFQRQVPGVPIESTLGSLDPDTDGERLAAAFHKLHSMAAPLGRTHTAEDEMAALLTRLRGWQVEEPARASRIQRLIESSVRAVAGLDMQTPSRLIHRDLHLGQILLGSSGKLWFVDLDLASGGDPALDIGNFVAHLLERGLREGHTDRYAEFAVSLVEEGRRLRGFVSRGHIERYTQLSLARLAHLSRVYADRRHTTDALLELACDEVATQARRIA